jgi:hypothetical protein
MNLHITKFEHNHLCGLILFVESATSKFLENGVQSTSMKVYLQIILFEIAALFGPYTLYIS